MTTRGKRELAVLDQASRILAEAKSLDDIKTIRDKAEAARTYARAAQLGLSIQNRAAEVKLRAERKAGQYLSSLKLRGGDRRSNGHRVSLKLADLGITQQQSKRWQSVGSISYQDFSDYLQAANTEEREVTSAGLIRAAGKPKRTISVGQLRYAETPDNCACCRMGDTMPQDLILELTNHCKLLANVLSPILEEIDTPLQCAERRLASRLIIEMRVLIKQLNDEWQKSISRDG